MTVKCIEELELQFKHHAFVNWNVLENADVFVVPVRHSYIGHSGCVAERVWHISRRCIHCGDLVDKGRLCAVGVRICAICVRSVEEAVHIWIGSIGRVERIDALPPPSVGGALDRNVGNKVVSGGVLPAGYSDGAAERHWLAVLIAQDGSHLPAAQKIAGQSGVQELLAFSYRKFIEGT